jgi:hypothetical protein
MGPVDYIEHADLPAALSPDLSESLRPPVPNLQAPTFEEIPEDQRLASPFRAIDAAVVQGARRDRS